MFLWFSPDLEDLVDDALDVAQRAHSLRERCAPGRRRKRLAEEAGRLVVDLAEGLVQRRYYAIPCYTIPYYAILYHTIPYSTLLY